MADNNMISLIETLKFDRPFSIYIHIPFCIKKCGYCDFYSIKYGQDEMESYLQALNKEIGLYADLLDVRKIETIYLGGGTPSLLAPDQLERMLQLIIDHFSYPLTEEITLEGNPSSLSENKIKAYRKMGINRLSLGIQSFNDKELEFLGRLHDRRRALQIISKVSDYFKNYSVDLISAIPGQSVKDWEKSLLKALEFRPPHLSIYNLQLEEGTPLGEMLAKGQITPVDDELDAEMYLLTERYLGEGGYLHYEISNYALAGKSSCHNKNYWEYRPYLGLGPGAHSFDGWNRFYNNYSFKIYLAKLSRGELPIASLVNLSKKERMSEMIFMGLRLKEGISCNTFKELFGQTPRDVYGKELIELEKKGLISIKRGRVKLTDRGILLGNEVFACFV